MLLILCGTNNIYIDSPYDIVQCLIDIGVCFRNCSSKINIFISRILPRDECYSLNRMLIKEINAILKSQCGLHSFNFIEQEQGWISWNDWLKQHDWSFTILPWQAAFKTKREYQAIRDNYNSYRRHKYWSK